MFPEFDSFDYQSSPLTYHDDAIDSYTGMEMLTSGMDFPSFKMEDASLEWSAFDGGRDGTIPLKSNSRQEYNEKQKRSRPKVLQRKREKMTVFKPFQSVDSTELTVKMLRVWLDGSMSLDEMSKVNTLSASAMGF